MNAFGSLIQLLQCASSNEDQITLIVDHAQTLQSDDRAALAHLLANPPTQRRVKLTSLRELLHEHIDENLFNLSKSFVGDTAETIALLWPTKSGANRSPALAEIRTQLGQTGALELPKLFQRWLSACDANGRLTLIRLATGTFKNPVAIEVMRQAFDKLGLNVEISPAKSRRPTEQPDLFTTNSTPKPGTIDTVLMYVENGRRRSQETNCTLGIWDANELVPICRVPAGEFSHEILNYAQSNTTKRFGTTLEVERSKANAIMLTVAFDNILKSSRRKAGWSLVNPRILALTPKLSLHDAAHLDDLKKLLLDKN